MAAATLSPRIPPREVLDSLKFRKRFLNSLKPDVIGNRSDWLRFVMVRAEPGNVCTMAPRLAPGAVLLLDRHCNSLEQYHRGTANIYAVRVGEQCAIRYVAVVAGSVILGRTIRNGRFSWWRSAWAEASPSTLLGECVTWRLRCERLCEPRAG